jgi:heme/copper-type cytochrome/quinol oxidase subunit 1
MIGARDMAFPRLNAFSFWLTAFGGLLLYFSLVGANGLYGAGNAPDVGWFAYAPLTSRTFSVGHSTDFWTLSLLVSGFGSIGTAVNILTTILCMRCPGMSLDKMPLLAWLNLNMFFVLSTMAIAVPTGIKIFNWLATMWGGKIEFKTPMLFCVGFLFQFLIAGLTGIMLGAAPFDWQLGNSYFVVAHFHYVIVGAILFTIFGAFYYWFPKMSGKMYSETLGKLHFWVFLIGFHLTFDFMHIPGLLGMPRRIYTYEPGRGWDVWNLIVTIGVFFQALAIVVFVANLLWSYFNGRTAGSDPWDAWTLEWSTPSPPPAYNFSVIPTVKSRRPLWDLKHPADPDWKFE